MEKIFIISGSIGAGKDSILKGIREKRKDLYWAITTTNKLPRTDESYGNPYYFISKEKFMKLIKDDAFFEYENVYSDKFFGMTKKEIEKALSKNKKIIWQIDFRGYRKIKKIFKNRLVSIFIKAPSLEVAEKRIRKRSKVGEDFIKERMGLAKKEIEASKEYDYVIINKEGQLKKSINQVLDIIDEETN